MRCVLAIAFAVLLVVANGKPTSEPAPENQQPFQLESYIQKAQTAINDIGAQMRETFNLPNQNEILDNIKVQTNNFASNVQQYIHNMTEEVKNKGPEIENAWTNAKAKLTEMANQISVNPETTEQLNQLKTKLEEGIQTIMTQTKSVAESFQEKSDHVKDDINNFTKNVVDMAVEATQNLNNQLQQAAQPAAQS